MRTRSWEPDADHIRQVAGGKQYMPEAIGAAEAPAIAESGASGLRHGQPAKSPLDLVAAELVIASDAMRKLRHRLARCRRRSSAHWLFPRRAGFVFGELEHQFVSNSATWILRVRNVAFLIDQDHERQASSRPSRWRVGHRGRPAHRCFSKRTCSGPRTVWLRQRFRRGRQR